jgi:hypothetical protein
MVRVPRTPDTGLNVGLFGISRPASPRSLSEVTRTSALRAGARRREGWTATGRTKRHSGTVIGGPPWLGRVQAWTEIQLAGGEPFDDQHDAGAGCTAEAGCLWRIDPFRHAEQSAAAVEHSTPPAVGEESEVADANQAAGQHVKQEAAQELIRQVAHSSPYQELCPVRRGPIAMSGSSEEVEVGSLHRRTPGALSPKSCRFVTYSE